MQCPRCQHETSPRAKFCEECAIPLVRTCSNCGTQLSPTARFCPECARPADAEAAPPRFASPGAYTPKHLVERILTSKTAREAERKQVTVLFADLKGSMELLADRDPEDARKILDPVLEHLMEARARKPPRPKQKADPPKTSARLPQELARDAIAHEEPMPGDKVKMTFRVVLARQDAEALAARAIREEKNIATVVTEILEAAAR